MTSLVSSSTAVCVQPLTAEKFAPYGDVIEAVGKPIAINDGKTLSFHDLAKIDPGHRGRTIVSIFRSTPAMLPLAIEKMERHPLGSQTFMPLSARPYLIVVAAAGAFNPNTLRAFRTNGTQGINFRKGTWHHFNLALEIASEFLVLDRSGPGVNLEEVILDEAVTICSAAPRIRGRL